MFKPWLIEESRSQIFYPEKSGFNFRRTIGEPWFHGNPRVPPNANPLLSLSMMHVGESKKYLSHRPKEGRSNARSGPKLPGHHNQHQFVCRQSLMHSSDQIIATSYDLTPNGGLVREIPLFQGNLGW